MTRFAFATALIAALFLTNCGGTPVLPGDLGKMTDGVLVPCEPISGEERSCLVLANPSNENLKVFDATSRQFLLAPRGYTTLGIPVGARTSRLASAPELDFVLALDVVERKVYRVRTRGKTAQTPTFAVAATFKTEPDVFDFALAKVGRQNDYSLIYALPSSLLVARIDNTTAIQNQSRGFEIKFSRPISCFTVDHASGYLAVGFQDDKTFGAGGSDPKTVLVIKLSDIPSPSATTPTPSATTPGLTENKFTPIYIGGFASQLRLTNLVFDTKTIPFVFAIKSDSYELVATRIDTPQPQPVAIKSTLGVDNHKFDHLLTALYLPPRLSAREPEPCCGGSKRWAAVTTVRGSFHYVTVGDLASDEENPRSLDIGQNNEQTIPLSDETHLGSQAVFPTAIFGGPVIQPPNVAIDDAGVNCRNRIFITFQSGVLASACEGQKGFSKVGL